jgi:hypothetical protein
MEYVLIFQNQIKPEQNKKKLLPEYTDNKKFLHDNSDSRNSV